MGGGGGGGGKRRERERHKKGGPFEIHTFREGFASEINESCYELLINIK